MPIYEFKCESCGTVTERLQRMDDKPLKKCPKCGGSVRKIVSRSSFQLKGGGWYVTDYGKGTGGAAGTKKKSKSAEEGSKSESAKRESASSAAEEGSKSESAKSESASSAGGSGESKTRAKSKKTASKGD
jgi:putative FmdB family regulatory protein